ncbi:MAG: KH domain-containing protein [Thermoanaerobaculia bacterium]|nr:MAG: KH domain-containing protein [Thermoanaerobaculia bacterium]
MGEQGCPVVRHRPPARAPRLRGGLIAVGAAEDLLAVVRLLVDEPREVAVDEVTAEGVVELRVRLAAGDRGKLIGRRGRTIDALRALARVRGERDGRDLEVELHED